MEYIYAFLCFSSLWRPKYCINLFCWQQTEDWLYACTVLLSVSIVRWFRLCKHAPNSWFFVLLLVYPTPSYDDNNGRSWGFIGLFLWLPLSIAEAATGFTGLRLSVSDKWRAQVLAWVGGLLPFSPVPSLPSTGTLRQLWALSQPDTGGGVWLFGQHLLLKQLFPISSKEKVAGHMEASCGPNSADGRCWTVLA